MGSSFRVPRPGRDSAAVKFRDLDRCQHLRRSWIQTAAFGHFGHPKGIFHEDTDFPTDESDTGGLGQSLHRSGMPFILKRKTPEGKDGG